MVVGILKYLADAGISSLIVEAGASKHLFLGDTSPMHSYGKAGTEDTVLTVIRSVVPDLILNTHSAEHFSAKMPVSKTTT